MEYKLHSINEFLQTVPSLPQFKNISKGQLMGFKALMKSKGYNYVFNLKSYILPLKTYLTE